MYSLILSLTSMLDEGWWPLAPGKEIRYPFYRRLGGPRVGPNGWETSLPYLDSTPDRLACSQS
jgi:hypothetical protein